MQPLFEHRLKVDGFSTRALELEGSGPPLVLFHGYSDSADTWRLLLDRLGRANRRALAVDLPGFGAASPLGPGPILPQYDAFAAALIRAVGREHGPVIAVGNSLGGVVSLRAAEIPGLPLRGVVPVAPAGLDMPRWFEIIERDPLVRSLLTLPFPIPAVVLREIVGQVYRQLAFARPRGIAPEVIRAFTAHHADRAAIAGYLETGRRLLPELHRSPFDWPRISAPVLLIWGMRDRMVSHSGARTLSAALPNAQVELLPGIGHCPQIEAVDQVFDLITTWRPAASRVAATA